MENLTGGLIQGGEPTMVTKISDQVSSTLDEQIGEGGLSAALPDILTSNSDRLFGREQSVHTILGGGKYADILLWRNKKMSATVFGGATTVWFLFEVHEYHFITFVCHILLIILGGIFFWTKASSFINRSAPQIPEIDVPDHTVLAAIYIIKTEMNHGLAELRDIASGRDLRKFLGVTIGLWFLSLLGGWFDFLTLLYFICFLMFSLPALYEKYQDQVDPIAQKSLSKVRKNLKVLDHKVLSKIPHGTSKDKKQ